jgi:hypothetical protein
MRNAPVKTTLVGINQRTPARIGQGGEKASDPISTFRIGQESTKNRLPRLLLSFQPVPIRGGNFFQKLLDLAIAPDPEANDLLLLFRDIKLLDFAPGASGQDQSRMLFPPQASTAGLSTDLFSQSGGGAEELPPRDERLELGAALPLGFGHSRRMHG